MKSPLRLVVAAFAAAVSAGAAYAVPEVTSCTMEQANGNGIVTVRYRLSEAPAVVTLDIQTNYFENAVEKWASIGGEHICTAQGSVWRKVTTGDLVGEDYVITWDPALSWKDDAGNGFKVNGTTRKARAEVTAWALDNTPDYMVVDIMNDGKAKSQDARCTYYPAVDFLPGSELGQKGAVTNNPAYKQSYVVMRKILAKDVVWTMGSIGEGGSNETPHEAQLTNNYYIGVFEFTQGQMMTLNSFKDKSGTSIESYFTAERQGRPFDMNKMTYIGIRVAYSGMGMGILASEWPNPPDGNSFIKQLRDRTGVDFDLPSEAEWEFAARAGHGSGYWGDGSPISIAGGEDVNLNRLARYKKTVTATSTTATTPPAEGGTAIVGSYAPNDWGLYDMYGNVEEWCLDAWLANPSSLRGGVKTATSADASVYRVLRGGNYSSSATGCRSATRSNVAQTANWDKTKWGFRLACRAGLK